MNEDQRHHFRQVCVAVLACYVDPHITGLILIGDPRSTNVLTDMLSLGATDIASVHMLTAAQAAIGTLINADAPPRELYS